MAGGRRRRQQWVEIIEGMERSGQSQQGYAAECGVSLSALQYWRRKLRDEPRKELEPVRFVEVLQEQERPAGDSAAVRLTLGGVTLAFDSPPSPRWLAELLRQVRASTC